MQMRNTCMILIGKPDVCTLLWDVSETLRGEGLLIEMQFRGQKLAMPWNPCLTGNDVCTLCVVKLTSLLNDRCSSSFGLSSTRNTGFSFFWFFLLFSWWFPVGKNHNFPVKHAVISPISWLFKSSGNGHGTIMVNLWCRVGDLEMIYDANEVYSCIHSQHVTLQTLQSVSCCCDADPRVLTLFVCQWFLEEPVCPQKTFLNSRWRMRFCILWMGR